jgi:predicted Rossmann fold nucleotide-binding protein DprA/Smf involved in DNA uptake
MPCPPCQRRSALVAALAPAISRLSFTRHTLLRLLALPDEQLLRAAKVEDSDGLLRRLQPPLPTDCVPTALCRHDPDYPTAPRQLPSAPAVLYASATIERLRELRSKPTVALVGSPTPNEYAHQMTSMLARNLAAAGVTVISGVNDGLEGFAQRAALNAGGSPIAVMACAPDLSHLTRHDHLHRRILAHGTAVSEFPPGFFPPPHWCFIASQRITAALASVTVVVEVGDHSPALSPRRSPPTSVQRSPSCQAASPTPEAPGCSRYSATEHTPSPAPKTCSR